MWRQGLVPKSSWPSPAENNLKNSWQRLDLYKNLFSPSSKLNLVEDLAWKHLRKYLLHLVTVKKKQKKNWEIEHRTVQAAVNKVQIFNIFKYPKYSNFNIQKPTKIEEIQPEKKTTLKNKNLDFFIFEIFLIFFFAF
jgi:hypothetical protein